MAEKTKPPPSGKRRRLLQKDLFCDDIPANGDCQLSSAIRDAAKTCLGLGFSVIPVNTDKIPVLPWKKYQKKPMTPDEAMGVFQNGNRLALVCGAVSGNLECLDFDEPPLFKPFMDTLKNVNTDLAGSLVKIQTPSGGYHLVYRCSSPVDRNQKLAMSADGITTRIETRGQGGYFLTIPSPGYALLEGNLETLPRLSKDDVTLLHALARSFSQKPEPVRRKSNRKTEDARPGDDYNQRADESVWRQLLEPHGWIFTDRITAGGRHLTRPGKDKGTSATLKDGCLYVFSTNAGFALGPNDAFGVYTHYHHNGDFALAAKALGSRGYGIPIKAKENKTWPEPQPLVTKIDFLPYPMEALPPTIHGAVSEVQAFTKAPVALVASCALAAVSLAVQGHVDVKRDNRLIGPTSLFLLTIADSGERKSTCDGYFTTVISDYEKEQAEKAKPLVDDFQADMDAWTAERNGLLDQIRQSSKGGRPISETKEKLRELEGKKPNRPRIPRMIRGDETPESLSWELKKIWPSGGILSNEGGNIFGAHAMGQESIMRNLSLLNVLWDGGTHSTGRKTSESFVLRSARLTMGLQIQEPALRSFYDRSKGLARGNGFFARFLVAWPTSTQGYRPYSEPPAKWPGLDAFNRRMAALLAQPVNMDEDGALIPHEIAFSHKAKEAWKVFNDDVESRLRPGGELFDVRDVASKIADNAARMAALFQVFESGTFGDITMESFESAQKVASWHLNEARRFFGELAFPEEINNAAKLDAWMLDWCNRNETAIIPRREIQQYGPWSLRGKRPLDEALGELEALGRVRLREQKKRKEIEINPGLLEQEEL